MIVLKKYKKIIKLAIGKMFCAKFQIPYGKIKASKEIFSVKGI